NPGEAEVMFQLRPTEEVVRPFAAFVKYVGDLFAQEEKYSQALRRYLLAWEIDANNGPAAAYAAAIIRNHPDVDPEGRALAALVEDIFNRKAVYIAER